MILYLQKLTVCVEKKINERISDLFALIFNGWLFEKKHYIGVFGSIPSDGKEGYTKVLLEIYHMDDVSTQNVEDHQEFLKFVLSVLNKGKDNVISFVGDNTNTNRAFSRNFDKLLDVCHIHRFKFAVNDFLLESQFFANKVNDLMKKMFFSIPAALICRRTPLVTKSNNVTR